MQNQLSLAKCFPFEIYQNVKVSIKKADLFAEKMNIYWLIYLSPLSQMLDALSRFERNLQVDFSENFQKLCCVTYWAKIKNSDYFAEVIMS